jgi:hypothetical protein
MGAAETTCAFGMPALSQAARSKCSPWREKGSTSSMIWWWVSGAVDIDGGIGR